MKRHAFTTDEEWEALLSIGEEELKKYENKGMTQREIARLVLANMNS